MVTILFGVYLVLWLFCFVMCVCVGGGLQCVGVLTTVWVFWLLCVLVFTVFYIVCIVFLYCFVYVYLFLLVTSVRSTATE